MKRRLIGLTTLCLTLMMGFSSVSAHTPPGLAKKGGLPPGIQKKFFGDMEDINEIRSIIDILEKKGIKDIKDLLDIIEKKDINEYNTTIKDIDVKEKRIVIEDGTAMLSLLVSKETKIKLNDKAVKLEDLRKKDKVYIKLDKDNTITELKATREKEVEYTVEGKLLLIREDQDKLYIYEDEKLVTYELDSDVIVRINGEKVKIDKLDQGMEVKLTIEDKKVTLIEGTKDVEDKRLEGKILAKYDGKDPLVIIQIDNDIKVLYVDKDVDMSKVKADEEAVIYVRDNKVISIRMR